MLGDPDSEASSASCNIELVDNPGGNGSGKAKKVAQLNDKGREAESL